jgi:hypothetical protein
MSRVGNCFGVFMAVVVIGLAWRMPPGRTDPAPAGKPPADRAAAAAANPAPEKARDHPGSRAGQLRAALARPVDLDKGIEAKTPLREALDALGKQYQLPILVDTAAFQTDLQVQEVESQPVQLPPMTGVTLGTVLQKLAAQVQGGYLLRPDHVEITTRGRLLDEVWGNVQAQDDDNGRPRPLLQLVQAAFDKRPLEDALKELSAATGTSVLVDLRRAGERAKAPVTAALSNVPLDTAVRLLANQAGLHAVLLDDVLFVTTDGHARRVQSEREKPPGEALTSGLAVARQLGQAVNLDLEDVPLNKALQELARETDTQVVLDPKVGREGQLPVTLRLKEVSLETAVRLVCQLADLKPVVVGNVVFVTNEATAVKLQTDLMRPLVPTVVGGLNGLTGGAGGAGLGMLGGGGGLAGIAGGGALGFAGGSAAVAYPKTVGGRTPLPGADGPAKPRPGKPASRPDQLPKPGAKGQDRAGRLPGLLARVVDLPNGFDAAPLKEALEFLKAKHGLMTLMDTEAFKRDLMVQEVENQPVRLPRLAGVRLATVLDKLLAQVQGGYLVRPDHLEVTTRQRVRAEVWGPGQPPEEDSGRQRPQMQLVQAEFDQRPLEEALQEVAETTGVSVVLDRARVGDLARAPVTASFTNVPLDTAIRLLTDQAGLQSVLLDDVFAVTTEANARALQAEQDKADQKGLAKPEGGPPAAGGM